MRRRRFLGALGGAAAASALAGCGGLLGGGDGRPRGVLDDRPNEPYVPTHVDMMEVVGVQEAGPYSVGLMFTLPHRFWLVTGSRTREVVPTRADTVHLMAVPWHRETGIVPPDVSLQMTVTLDGEQVDSRSPWQMLSQPMGFHFGDNVALDGEGTYTVEVTIGGASATRTGSLADATASQSVTFEWAYSESAVSDIGFRQLPEDRVGTPGAVDPMAMGMLPQTTVPEPGALPGTTRGTTTAGDVEYAVTTLPDAAPFGGDADQPYLAVSPRTPHNRYVFPLATIDATLAADGEPVFDDGLTPTLDPDLGYHYGAPVSAVESGADLSLSLVAPPQVARHAGYETAFFDVPAATLRL